MEIIVSYAEGSIINAGFGKFHVKADSSIKNGGEELFPEPADYFFASMALCAGYYLQSFCKARDISTDGITITQNSHPSGGENRFQKNIGLVISLPKEFPEKYRKSLTAVVSGCTVKKMIEAAPNFSVDLA
jgi:uncharacterized OsmC-like protein